MRLSKLLHSLKNWRLKMTLIDETNKAKGKNFLTYKEAKK